MTDREFYKWEIRLLPPTHPHQMQPFVWQGNRRCLTAPALEALAKREGELRKTRIQGSRGGPQEHWLQFRKTRMHHAGHSVGSWPVSTQNYGMADEAGQTQRALKVTAPNCYRACLDLMQANQSEDTPENQTLSQDIRRQSSERHIQNGREEGKSSLRFALKYFL